MFEIISKIKCLVEYLKLNYFFPVFSRKHLQVMKSTYHLKAKCHYLQYCVLVITNNQIRPYSDSELKNYFT